MLFWALALRDNNIKYCLLTQDLDGRFDRGDDDPRVSALRRKAEAFLDRVYSTSPNTTECSQVKRLEFNSPNGADSLLSDLRRWRQDVVPDYTSVRERAFCRPADSGGPLPESGALASYAHVPNRRTPGILPHWGNVLTMWALRKYSRSMLGWSHGFYSHVFRSAIASSLACGFPFSIRDISHASLPPPNPRDSAQSTALFARVQTSQKLDGGSWTLLIGKFVYFHQNRESWSGHNPKVLPAGMVNWAIRAAILRRCRAPGEPRDSGPHH